MQKHTLFQWYWKRHTPILLAGLLTLALLLIGCGGEKTTSADDQEEAASQPAPQGFLGKLGLGKTTVILPAGTDVPVRLLHSISSRTARSGDEFEAELASPISIEGKTAFARGAAVRGRVVTARASGRLQDPGILKLTLDSVQAEDGKWVDLETTSVSAKGESHAKRNTALIGGGAGVGAIIGGIAGGGKGAAIGAASGAGAGTAGALATGRKDVTFSAERRLSFALTREVEL